MTIIASDDFAGIADGTDISGRTLNNSLGGTGSRTWHVAGSASLGGNGSGALDAYTGSQDARNGADLTGLSVRKARVKIDPSGSTSNVVVFGLRTVTGGSSGNYISALLAANQTSLRVRQGTAENIPSGTDRASLTVTAPGTTFWLELEINGLVVTARILNSDNSVRNETSWTASSLPTGTNWGFGFASGGSTGTFDDFIVDDGASGDTTAPTLTTATATATSGTTSSGSVSTDENNGTLYWLTNTSASATATAVKAGSSQAVTATGTQNVTSTGLSPGTTYYTHFLHRDAAGNDSAVLSSASFTTPAPDTTAPTFTGSITVGAKTSSSIALTLPTASDNVAVTGYEYRVDGGAWVDNGNSTAVALSGLTALTSYTVDARAYDAAANVSSTLSVTTSTYRAGASAGSIRTTTGPQDGNPAGLLYDFCELLPVDSWVSYSIVSGPTPSGGTLDAQANGAFSYVGPDPATLVIQPEVNGVADPDTITVTLYDQTAVLVGGSDVLGYTDAGGELLAELALLTGGADVVGYADEGGAVTQELAAVWPARGVRAIVSPGGVDPEPVKVFEQYSFDREVYEVDFDAKYLAGLDDTADELRAFSVPSTVPAESRVVVGQALDSGVVMFGIGPDVPVGVHEVLVKIGTAGGRTKGVIVQIKVDR